MSAKSTNPSSTALPDLLDSLGSFGRFHRLTLLRASLVLLATCGIFNTLPFLTVDPSFSCRTQNNEYTKCSQEIACRSSDFKINHEIFSIVSKHETFCERRWMKLTGLNLLFVFSGAIVTGAVFWLDKKGRKPVFVLAAVLTITGWISLLFIDSFWLTMTVYTILYSAGCVMNNNSFVYAGEIFNGKWRSFASSSIYFASNTFNIGFVLVNVYFDHYMYNVYLMVGLSVVCLPMVFSLIETPYYFYNNKDTEGLRKTLYEINKGNNKHDQKVLLENKKRIDRFLETENFGKNVSNGKDKKVEESFFDRELGVLKYVKRLVVIFITIIPGYAMGGLVNTVPDKLGLDNIYISSIAFSLVVMATNAVLMFHLHKVPTKKGIAYFALIIISFCSLFFLTKILQQKDKFSSQIFELVLTILLNGVNQAQFLLIVRYTGDVFPFRLKAISTGLVLLVGRMSMFLGVMIEPLSERAELHPFIFVAILYLLSLPFIYMYKQTESDKIKID